MTKTTYRIETAFFLKGPWRFTAECMSEKAIPGMIGKLLKAHNYARVVKVTEEVIETHRTRKEP